MKCLIVDNEISTRMFLQEQLPPHFVLDIVMDGDAAVEAFKWSHESKCPYQLIFLDAMTPECNDNDDLLKIRELEKEFGISGNQEVKVIMATPLDNPKTVIDSELEQIWSTLISVKSHKFERFKAFFKNMFNISAFRQQKTTGSI